MDNLLFKSLSIWSFRSGCIKGHANDRNPWNCASSRFHTNLISDGWIPVMWYASHAKPLATVMSIAARYPKYVVRECKVTVGMGVFRNDMASMHDPHRRRTPRPLPRP